MFRLFVVIVLAVIAYGVLYRNLPCPMQILDKTLYCQMVEEGQRLREHFKMREHGR